MGDGSSSFCVVTKHKTEQQNYCLYFFNILPCKFSSTLYFMDKTFIKK